MSFRERRFLKRLQERDETAFRELVAEFKDRIFNLLYRMTGSREEAEDLAQEVFVTVFKRIDQFRGESQLSTWMYRVAINHCKNRIKYLSRRHEKRSVEFDEMALPSNASAGGAPTPLPRPDRALLDVERERIVQAAIADLEEDHRVLVVLRDIEELSYDEIMIITGLAEGTVKSRLHRARLALRERLTAYMRDKEPT